MKWKRQIQNEYTSPFFSYKLKIIMRWSKLFERLPTADEIYFRYYDISFDLKESPKYLEYIKEKIALRHDIEKNIKVISLKNYPKQMASHIVFILKT